MRATVEIKYNSQIKNVDQIDSNSSILENLIDNLLDDGSYFLQDIYLTSEESSMTFTEDEGKTVMRIVLEMEQKLIANSYDYEAEIIEAVAGELGKRYMEIVDVTETDGL